MENSLLLPPVGVWAVLSPSLADHPLRPATDHRLGEPLPHQQTNQTQAAPKAHKALIRRSHAVLDTISGAYPSVWGTFLRVTLPSATPQHIVLEETRNPNTEIRNKSEIRNFQTKRFGVSNF